MLSFGKFTPRFFLVVLILIYVIIHSFLFFYRIYYTSYFFGLKYSSDELIQMFVNYLLGIFGFVVLISPPLLSLFLLRRPSFWRVLLHVATTIYILWIAIAFFTASTPESSLWTLVTFIFLLVYSIAALVAGLLEAVAAMPFSCRLVSTGPVASGGVHVHTAARLRRGHVASLRLLHTGRVKAERADAASSSNTLHILFLPAAFLDV